MIRDLSEYFIETNKTVHEGRFFGSVKFDPVHSGNIGFDFTADDILADSVSIVQRVSSESDITIGGVFLGVLKIAFLSSVTSQRTASDYWTKAMISLYYEEFTGHGESESGEFGWESIKVGDYYIKDAVFEGNILYLTAYDGMCLFDQPANEDLSGKPYDMVKRCVDKAQNLFDISIKFGIEDRALFEMIYPNANVTYSLYVENDIHTYRDLLYWVAVTIGGFIWVDRDGYVRVFSYHPDWTLKDEPDCIIDYTERIAGSSQIYDFVTSWDGILIDDLVNEETVMDNNGYTDKLMSLGAIPFFQNLTELQKSDYKIALGSVVINDMNVRPCKVNLRSAPIYDVGDKLALRNGDFTPWEDDDGNVITIIHSWSFSKGILVIQSYGAKRSTVYTQRSGGGSGSSGGTIGNIDRLTYFHYENDSLIVADTLDEYVELGSIDFYANQATIVECLAQLNPFRNGIVQAKYYWELDGNLIYSSTSTNPSALSNSRPIETLAQLVEVQTTGLHTIKLKVQITNQDSSSDYFRFATDSVRMILKGQGLEHKSVWNGVISCADSIELLQQENNIVPYDDSLSISNPTVNKETLSDTQPPIGAALNNLELSDDGVTVTIETP